jgi:hypothetical protein
MRRTSSIHNMSAFNAHLLALLNRLDDIAIEHPEITDSEVREALAEVINYSFIWQQSTPPIPRFYRAYDRANDMLHDALERFIEAVLDDEEVRRTPPGIARLKLFQNEQIVTPSGNHFDLYFGLLERPLAPRLSQDLV